MAVLRSQYSPSFRNPESTVSYHAMAEGVFQAYAACFMMSESSPFNRIMLDKVLFSQFLSDKLLPNGMVEEGT